jgi:trigger factor
VTEAEREPVEPEPAEAFDPAEHTVADVLAYLADADDDERARVLAAEAAGEARATILKKGAAS